MKAGNASRRRSQRGRHRPKDDDVPVLSWVFSRRVWTATALFTVTFVGAVGVVGSVLFGHPLVDVLVLAATDEYSLLSTFFVARGFALYVAQKRRDRAVYGGQQTVGSDVSVVAMLTVGSFSLVGIISAAVAFPFLYEVTGYLNWLAIGITALVVPISFPLLVHQLTEKVSADRYRRGLAVSPATSTFLWTGPLLVHAWFELVHAGDPIPVTLPDLPVVSLLLGSWVGKQVFLGTWDFLFAAIVAPTALVFTYTFRRYAESVGRALVR